jgi:hypothetical protein
MTGHTADDEWIGWIKGLDLRTVGTGMTEQ